MRVILTSRVSLQHKLIAQEKRVFSTMPLQLKFTKLNLIQQHTFQQHFFVSQQHTFWG